VTPDQIRAATDDVCCFMKRWGILEEPQRGKEQRIAHFAKILADANLQPTDEVVQWLIDLAKSGDHAAEYILNCWIGAAGLDSRPLPRPLAIFLTDRLRLPKPPARKGQSPHKWWSRNQTIIMAIWLTTQAGFRPFRNAASKKSDRAPSACSIVKDALARLGISMSEDNVNKIWSKTPEAEVWRGIQSANTLGAIREILLEK